MIMQNLAIAGTKREADKKKAIWDKTYPKVTIRKVKNKLKGVDRCYGSYFYQVLAWVD